MKSHINLEKISKIVHLVLYMPGTIACLKHIFSLVKMFWDDEKSRLYIGKIKTVITIKTHFNLSCSEFYDYLISKQKLLKAIHSSKKYNEN